MPLVKRKVHPKFLSRHPTSWGVTESGEEVTFEGDYDLTAVTNISLCGALQQLASLVLIAEEIGNELEEELYQLSCRTQNLTSRFVVLEANVLYHNPRVVPVPESDLKTFSELRSHYENSHTFSQMLFTPEKRPPEIQKLYEEAEVQGPVRVIREIDRFRDDGVRSSKFFKCTPIFGDSLKKEKLKKLNLDIETRRPASFVALREWCSDDETLQSEVELAPVSPATPLRPPPPPHPSDQKLPLPEQRLLAFSCKFPPQVIPIDVSGRGFRRMELFRQSLVQFEYVKSKRRKRRLKRRNTIADAREAARSALKHHHQNLPSTSSGQGRSSPRSGSPSSRGGISSYTDPSFDTTLDTTSTKTSSERGERHHHIFGLDISIPTPPRNVHTLSRHLARDCNSFRDDIMNNDSMLDDTVPQSSPRDFRKKGGRKKALNVSYDLLPDNVINGGLCTPKRQNPIGNVSTSKSILPISTPSAAMSVAVKLREGNSRDEGTRSSSGNWSGSSSTRTSLESDIQQQHNHVQLQQLQLLQQHQSQNNSCHLAEEERLTSSSEEDNPPNNVEQDFATEKASSKLEILSLQIAVSPSSSFEQDSFVSDSYPVRLSSPLSNQRSNSRTTEDFPSSSSQASDGTLTPTQDIQDIPFFDDDTGSGFSCDTEGYYTSFHIDSGLRSVSYEDTKLASESEADLFGRGSTGTTNSSASLGTVIMRNPDKKTPPKPPQRVSSLERKENRESIITVIHVNGSTSSSREDVAGAEGSEKGACLDGRDSGSSKECDSGRETSSSPTESMSPRQHALFSPEPDLESDIDSAERKDSFRLKTTISASGIPSMCVITPPQSDDESARSGQLTGLNNSKDSSTKVASAVQQKIQSFQATASFLPPSAGAVRQPGDGAVAPPVPPSRSPSYTVTSQSYAPSLTVMSQKRVESGAQFKNFVPQTEASTVVSTKPQGDHLSLGRSVSERRAEIQLKVLGDKKPSSDVLLQRQPQKEDFEVTPEVSNLVSYKELPTAVTAVAHPFSAVPSSVKQSVVITPTNSLERRKAHAKSGAHVTLDSEGKVVYSSDSLPRRKGHTSFEPGPYIKPPPISGASNVAQTRPKVPGNSSTIQNMPLPPVPGKESPVPVLRPSETPVAQVKPLPKTNEVQNHPTTTTPQQPKLGTRSQINAISQTLSGLSAHIQPRTISQINSMRSASVKSPKTVPSLESQKSSCEEDSVDGINRDKKQYDQLAEDASASASQYHYNKMQSQMTDHLESRLKETNSSTLPHRRSHTMGKENTDKQEDAKSKEIERLQYYSLQRQSQSQQSAQAAQPPSYQSLMQQQKQQGTPQQQSQSKHHILQQQHIQLQQQLEQQQQQLQQHKALKESQARAEAQAIYLAKKEAQALAQKEAQAQLLQSDNLYQRQDMQRQQLLNLQQQQMAAYQQPYYQTQEELYLTRQQMYQQAQQSRPQNEPQGHPEVIMATPGAPMSPQSQRGAYIHVQNQLSQEQLQPTATVGQTESSFPVRPQSAPGYHVGTTSRAPTPIQGLSTSSPQRLPTNSSSNALQHQNLRTHPGMMYGSQRSLQNMGVSTDGRGTPIPRPMSASPPPYEQYNLTNSDIYGRIGMTRQVQVGVVLPAGFGRNQRNYSSLPPNLRQPLTPSEVLAQQQQGRILRQSHHASGKTLTRRASVAGTETSNVKAAASNPSTPEKALEKKEKGSKRDKDREKKKKEAKNEKSPKKKWFWTLPLRRKKKNKDESSEDDDGGFKDATQKTTRKVVPAEEDTSFIRYPSPDTGSSDLNSSYSSDISSGEHGYRSSPSSEVYYYSQRAQTLQQQAAAVRSATLTGSMGVIPGATPIPTMGMPIPRSQPTTPVSPPDAQGIMTVDGTDITDLSRNRRYMSRDEMYAAMRHPQYYNQRNSLPCLPSDFSQNSTPTSSRSSSPALFGVNPPQPYVIRPQVRDGYQTLPKEHTSSAQIGRGTHSNEMSSSQSNSAPFKGSDKEDSSTANEIEPPAGYREIISTSSSPTDSQEETHSGQYTSAQTAAQRVLAKQTTLLDFKKMILEKSMNSAGGKERVSAVEMLRASRPSIYGYSLPPAPTIVKSQEQQQMMTPKGEGVIMPPNSRNTARALLFQSRFGSGRRFRSPKTEIISTTIVEDHLEEEESRLYEEDDEETSDEEEASSSTVSSQERHSVRSVVRALSEPSGQKVENVTPTQQQQYQQQLAKSKPPENNSSSAPKYSSTNGNRSGPPPAPPRVSHSTPNKANAPLPQEPNLSIITANDTLDRSASDGACRSPEKEAVETAL